MPILSVGSNRYRSTQTPHKPMQTNWMYIVTETLPEGFWRAPQTYSDPLPYGDALALLVDLEEQTSRDDINFELVAVAQH